MGDRRGATRTRLATKSRGGKHTRDDTSAADAVESCAARAPHAAELCLGAADCKQPGVVRQRLLAIVDSKGPEREEKHTLAHGCHGGVGVVADEAGAAHVISTAGLGRASTGCKATRGRSGIGTSAHMEVTK